MTSKLFQEKHSQKHFQIMFQICVLEQNVQENELVLHSWNFSLNAIIRNIKIHNTLDIIEILKSMRFNKRIWKTNSENIYLSIFYDFSKFNGSK
jgi:hypothetical protein